MKQSLKEAIKQLMPPILLDLVRGRLRFGPPEWELAAAGWDTTDPAIKGWNVPAVAEARLAWWGTFDDSIAGTRPLDALPAGVDPAEASLDFHNATMCYAYALTLASRFKSPLSMLDWGGGMGHHYRIGRALVADLTIDYHCMDTPVQVEYGRKLLPEAHFYTDESCLQRRYDFVMAKNSLYYARDWEATLAGLAASTADYLLVSLLPIVWRSPSFVFVQRAYPYGYNTEYLGWCLNREQFLDCAAATGLELVREFLMDSQPFNRVRGAPERLEYRGFLFRRRLA